MKEAKGRVQDAGSSPFAPLNVLIDRRTLPGGKQQGLRWSHMRRSTALLLRRSIPLFLAVVALLGPGTASAADPAPDPAGSGAPAPDPAPAAHAKVAPVKRAAPVAAPVAKHAVVVTPTFTPTPATNAPTVVAPQRPTVVVPVRKHVHRAKPVKHPEIKVIDVPPLRVDLHRGLGAVSRSLRDDSLLVLAGIALLVATLTAASGTTLAFVASRTSRSRR
jgi:hypothetical protein